MPLPERPPELAALQRLLFDLVVSAPGGLAPSAAERRAPAAVAWLCGSPDAIARGAEIYRSGYFLRLHEVLAGDFARVAKVVGAEAFRALVADYLDVLGSETPSLRHVGGRLPAFVAEHRLAARAPFISALARLEWARVEAFDAADVEPLTLDELRGLPPSWAGGPLPLVPAFQMLSLDHAVAALWSAADTDDALVPPDGPRPETLLVWRRDQRVYHRPVSSQAEVGALHCLARGRSFAEACEAYAGAGTIEAQTRAAFDDLGTWIADGLLAHPRDPRAATVP